MGREKRAGPAVVTAKDKARKRKEIDRKAPLPSGLKAARDTSTKYKSFFELVQNKDFKSKPLEFEKTSKREPPPLFAFVPVGNPELAVACKELSRERGAMVYIVSETKNDNISDLVHQTNRIGYHFRQQIVQEAARTLGIDYFNKPQQLAPNGCELIPSSQVDINNQARAAIDDLFPKMPGLDKEEIVARAFRKNAMFNGELVVGMQQDLTLSRRVQLAVLAHIRHAHTRYDDLLRETTWSNARRATEALCLDILVKWRGDDESGRDQLDEIMREIVVVTDDEDDDAPEDAIDDPDSDSSSSVEFQGSNALVPNPITALDAARSTPVSGRAASAKPQRKARKKQGIPVKSAKLRKAQLHEQRKAQKSLKRYEVAWNQALDRQRANPHPQEAPEAGGSASHGSYPHGFSDYPAPPSRPSPHPSTIRGPSQTGYTLGYTQSGIIGEPRPGSFFRPPPPLPEPHFTASERPAFEEASEPWRQMGVHNIARSRSRPSDGYNVPLQDMLHPSIEQPSPQRPSFGQREERPMTPTYRGPVSLQRIAADREGRPPVPLERHLAYNDDGHAPREWYEPRNRQPVLSDRGYSPMLESPFRPDAKSYGSSDAPLHRAPAQQRPLYERVPEYGHTQPSPLQREVIVLDRDRIMRDVHSPDHRISDFQRSRPAHLPLAPALAPQVHGSSMPEGFLRLRETVPSAPSHATLRDEGFVRLRESPQIRRDPATGHSTYPRANGQRSGLDGAYNMPDATPEQPVYVRRAGPGFDSPYRQGYHPYDDRDAGPSSGRQYDQTSVNPPARCVYKSADRFHRSFDNPSRPAHAQHAPYRGYAAQPMSAESSSNGYVIDDRQYTPRTPLPPDHQIILIDS
ncbi:uncharacterized protein VDAG_00907 [Verticillium dahliae VdLs.17]|uniref:DUF2293 domain-containing protein n=1 Tax=Verticillium dahliae (strain VdLs.17 / ATCC MYA-4575 / FGSC 10137) TaxID=498257 RepID=G2WSY4_VERDV|nr:uncharacterized protein VDAG_00907 [Verticillium dahliae VdLs.17]EGY17225.1 hypothetical protein VDAG_00907 [Verticillium dahliae VdLs.17]KAF3348760.1 Putative endo-1,3(4)-beta-glucanase [Verticillium dahliae VDG2]KAH6701680.1 hypothetical protein EV126DRAFT_339125 [Verticillium dahliae]